MLCCARFRAFHEKFLETSEPVKAVAAPSDLEWVSGRSRRRARLSVSSCLAESVVLFSIDAWRRRRISALFHRTRPEARHVIYAFSDDEAVKKATRARHIISRRTLGWHAAGCSYRCARNEESAPAYLDAALVRYSPSHWQALDGAASTKDSVPLQGRVLCVYRWHYHLMQAGNFFYLGGRYQTVSRAVIPYL